MTSSQLAIMDELKMLLLGLSYSVKIEAGCIDTELVSNLNVE